MKIHSTAISDLFVIENTLQEDSRGAFSRLYCQQELESVLQDKKIAQVNYSRSALKGTVRGMHMQLAPAMESKIVRCLKGQIFDVAIDLRTGSDTFLQWHGELLSQDNHRMMLIPEGFAHGFQTLTDDVEMLYFHTQFYAPGSEKSVRFDDPKVNIDWPLPVTEVSAKDAAVGLLKEEFTGVNI